MARVDALARKLLLIAIVPACSAQTLDGGARVVCDAPSRDLPGTVPVVAGFRQRPTATGFVEVGSQWQIDAVGDAERTPLSEEVRATAWLGETTALATLNAITLSGAQRSTCVATTRDISGVALGPDVVVWADVDSDLRNQVRRVSRSATACGVPQVVGEVVGGVLAFPALFRDTIWAVREPLGTAPVRLFEFVDGGAQERAQLAGFTTLCSTPSHLLVVGSAELLRVDLDGGVELVERFTDPVLARDCDGTKLAIAFEIDGGSAIATYSSTGRAISRVEFDTVLTAFGLGGNGGWVSLNQILQRWNGDRIETADTTRFHTARRTHDGLALGIGGTFIRWQGNGWEDFSPIESSGTDLPTWSGQVVRVNVEAQAYRFDFDGQEIVRWARTALSNPNLELQIWVDDPCSGDLLTSVNHDGRVTLVVRRSGAWFVVDVPSQSLLFAALEGSELVVAVNSQLALRRPVESGDWAESSLAIPEVVRALPSAGGLVTQTNEGIFFLRDQETKRVADRGRLLGVFGTEVLSTVDDVGIHSTRLP